MIILAIIVPLVVVAGIGELATRIVMGKWLDPAEVDAFLDRHEKEYREHQIRPGMIYGPPELPYIAKVPFTLSAKWYIGFDHGLIWRWSAATKRLDAWEAAVTAAVTNDRPKLKDL